MLCHWEPRCYNAHFVLVIHDVKEPTCTWQVVCHNSQDVVWLFISAWVIVYSPALHPIFVVVGICLYFYSGMGHWLWWEWLLWLIWQCYVPPPHSAKVINRYGMTSGVIMVMDGWGALHVVFESFCKCSACFSYIFILTVHPATLVSMYRWVPLKPHSH